MRKEKINKGIILAAGDGDRMGSLTAICPKVLLPVNGKGQLIRSPIEALAAVGISDIAVVVGHLGDKVIEVLGDGSDFGVRLQYIYNTDYLRENAISVYKAREWTQKEPVVLCMGDHLIEAEMIRRLLDRQNPTDTLCVDFTPIPHHRADEATKVAVDSAGRIQSIGKDLICWDALDTGTFLLTENFFQALHEIIQCCSTNITISDVVRFLVSRGHPFDTCDVSGCFWADIDTKEDLDLVRK